MFSGWGFLPPVPLPPYGPAPATEKIVRSAS